MKESTPKFIPTQWATAADKLKFYYHFIRFMERGMPLQDFPKWFYECLIHCFGHVAHMDRRGFYEYWFGEVQRRCYFLRHTLAYCAICRATYTYSDVEQAIQQWIGDHPEIVERYSNERDDLQGNVTCNCCVDYPRNIPRKRRRRWALGWEAGDRKSTRLNSSHRCISYAVFCLKKKK